MNILKTEKPQTIANILNGEQTILVMKRVPKNGEGRWWYLYCSKDKKNYLYWDWYDPPYVEKEWFVSKNPEIWADDRKNINGPFNGKIKARFWCDKVEEYVNGCLFCSNSSSFDDYESILEPSCLTEDKLYNYVNDLSFFAIHISKLEIFDRPRELSEFRSYKVCNETDDADYDIHLPITKAPQNYCYIEGE